MTERRWIGISLVLLSGMAIAVVPTSAKLAFDAGSNTLTVLAVRGLIGTALMAVLVAASDRTFGVGKRAFGLCVAIGLAHAAVSYGFIGSVAYIPVSLAVLVYSTHPILLAAIAHWQGGERLTPRKLLLALAALTGLALVLNAGFEKLAVAGVGLGLLASIAVCGVILLGARAQRDASNTQVNFYMMAVTAAIFAVPTTVGDAWSLPSGVVGWLGLAGAGIGVTIGLFTFLAAFRFISPVRATMISKVEPLFGILFAVAVLGESLVFLQWVGIVIVIVSLVLFELPPRSTSGSLA
jgi:drug/metabolite transporter (DMT)-like permease